MNTKYGLPGLQRSPVASTPLLDSPAAIPCSAVLELCLHSDFFLRINGDKGLRPLHACPDVVCADVVVLVQNMVSHPGTECSWQVVDYQMGQSMLHAEQKQLYADTGVKQRTNWL